MENEVKEIDQNEVEKVYEKGKKKAEKLLKDEDKVERLLQKMEKKLKVLPVVGGTFALVPAMISLIRSYIKKEYTEVPLGTILGVLSAIIYIVSPIDLVPDFIPGGGYIDDAAILILCLKAGAEDDIKDYQKWREENSKNLL